MTTRKVLLTENSNLVEVYTSTRSIWRGDVWSNLDIEIKVDQCFEKSSTHPFGRYMLVPHLENCADRSFIGADQNKVSFFFNDSTKVDKKPRLLISDQYNSLKVRIHQDLFSSGDNFRVVLVVEDRSNAADNLIFGASSIIAVTDLSFSIEQKFSQSPYTMVLEDNVYAWYSKCGGEKSGLDVKINLIDTNGPVKELGGELDLSFELVYEDGSPTPLTPLCPLKERNSNSSSTKPLFHIVAGATKINQDEPETNVTYRVEEVSFHHSGHDGFKLKVQTSNRSIVVHPAVSKETVVVLSKPKGGKRKRGSFSAEDAPVKTKAPSSIVEIPIDSIMNLYRVNGKCICCDRQISVENFFIPLAHPVSCIIGTRVAPLIQYGSEQDAKGASKTPLPTIERKNDVQVPSTKYYERPKDHNSNFGETSSLGDPNINSIAFVPVKANGAAQSHMTATPIESNPPPRQQLDLPRKSELYSNRDKNTFNNQIRQDSNMNGNLMGDFQHEVEEEDCTVLTLTDSKSLEENEKYLMLSFPLKENDQNGNDTSSFNPKSKDNSFFDTCRESPSFDGVEISPIRSAKDCNDDIPPTNSWIKDVFLKPSNSTDINDYTSTSSASSTYSKMSDDDDWFSNIKGLTPIRIFNQSDNAVEECELDGSSIRENITNDQIFTLEDTVPCKIEPVSPTQFELSSTGMNFNENIQTCFGHDDDKYSIISAMGTDSTDDLFV